MAAEPRKRPGNKKEAAPEAAAASSNGAKKEPKAPSLYHLFSEASNGNLKPVTDVMARNAEGAVAAFLDAPGDNSELAEKVTTGEAALVVVPDRNYTRVKAQVETKTRVKLSAV